MKRAQDLVGAPIEQGVVVNPAGSVAARMVGGATAGVAGTAVATAVTMAAESVGGGTSPLPVSGWSMGYLALTADSLVLLKAKNGLLAPSATEVLATAPRQRIAAHELGSGTVAAPLRIDFADGGTWAFAVPRVQMKSARRLVERLGPAA